jgi:hypothetical protein
MTASIRPAVSLSVSDERAVRRCNGAGQGEVTAVTDVLSAKLRQPASGPDTAAGALRSDATCLRCEGCGATATLAPREQHYGQLVHGFVDRHESCGGAVTLSRSRGRDG